MLAVSIVLFFICVFLSMMMALFDQDKKSDTKTLSTLQWLSYSLYGLSSLGIIVWSYTSFNIQSSNIWIAILLMVAYSLVYFIFAYKIPRRFANKNTEKIGFLTKLADFISTLFSWISWLFLIPLSVYFRGSLVKVEVALARGKKLYDKREDAAKKDAKRQIDRAMKGR